MSFQEFFDMNGFAAYVWGSYGIALIVFAAMLISVKSQRKSLVKQLRRRYRLQNDKQLKDQQKAKN